MAFYDVVKSLCDKKGISIRKLEREIGASNGSISRSKNGVKPNAERTQQIAEYFQVPIDYLLTGVMPEPEDGYYRNDQTKEIAQFLFDNPEYGVLFDAAKDVRPEFKPLITLPAKQLNFIIIPSNEQIKMIIDQIENTPLEIPVLLAAFGSLRASEVCALKKDCIFEDHISVRRSVVLNEKNEYITKNTPKSYAGYRDVYLPKDIMVKLQGIERATTYNPSSLTIAFRKVIKKLGLPEGIHFHSLRHYFATFCHAQGIPDKYIMKIGGWNNIDVLNKIYQHTTPAKEEAVFAQINDFYENLKK